jgi:hypothetical protein
LLPCNDSCCIHTGGCFRSSSTCRLTPRSSDASLSQQASMASCIRRRASKDKVCLALFPQSWADGGSVVEVVDAAPPGARFTRIDGETKGDHLIREGRPAGGGAVVAAPPRGADYVNSPAGSGQKPKLGFGNSRALSRHPTQPCLTIGPELDPAPHLDGSRFP